MTGRTQAMTVILACAFAVVALGGVPQGSTVGHHAAAGPCGWRATAPRDASPDDVPFDAHAPLLRDPEDANDAPGPGRLHAVVRTDRDHHPHIFLDDSASGASRLLIDRIANKPRWAPDGKRIACSVWKSRQRPWELCIVALASGDSLYPKLGAHVVKYRWSPDSRFLAVEGTAYGRAMSLLTLVETSSGRVHLIDSLSVFSDYDFVWSPDSRLLAASRPVRLLATEDIAESELWAFDLHGCGRRLVPSEGHLNHHPQWVNGHRVLYVSEAPESPAPPRRLVLDLSVERPRR